MSHNVYRPSDANLIDAIRAVLGLPPLYKADTSCQLTESQQLALGSGNRRNGAKDTSL